MRSKQNKKKMLIATVIGVFAGVAMLSSSNGQRDMINGLNTRLMEQDKVIASLKNSPSTGGVTPVQINKAVFAKADLAAGTSISPENAEVKDINPALAPRNGYADISALIGKTLAAPVKAGDYITKDKIAVIPDGSSLNLAPGMRAVTLPIDSIKGLASYVVVGSRVDILPMGTRNGVQDVLQNIKILSLENDPATPSNVIASKATGITFEVPTSMVYGLVSAATDGKLQVIARSPNDKSTTATIRHSAPRYSSHSEAALPPLNMQLPKVPGNISIVPEKGLTPEKSLGGLPEPTEPPKPPSRKVELIQANVKSEVSFDGN